MKNIASERIRLGMSQSELAGKLGVNRVTVARWEIGAAKPEINSVVTLANIFNCSTDYILGLSEERNLR